MLKKTHKCLLILLVITNMFGNISSRLIPDLNNIKINNQDEVGDLQEIEQDVNEVDDNFNSVNINDKKSNFNQPFQGYYSTSNIGVIPPKNADAGEYYNSIANLENKTLIVNHGNIDDSKNYESKSIKNLLDSIAKLHIMINSHDHKYQLINITKVDVNVDEIIVTPENLKTCGYKDEKTCGEDNTSFCTEDKVLYCVKTLKQDEECGDTCDDSTDCIANLVIDKDHFGQFLKHVKEGRKLQKFKHDDADKAYLCVTKKKNLNFNAPESNNKKFCVNCDYDKSKKVGRL